jgi:hypothetical protein
MKKLKIIINLLYFCSVVGLIASDRQEEFDFVDASFPGEQGMNLDTVLSNYIGSVKDSIQKERLFAVKAVMLAQGKSGINDLVAADAIDLQIARGEFDLILSAEQNAIQGWQNYYESIIGRNRTDIAQIQNIPEIARDQFEQARAIYLAIQALQDIDFVSIADALQKNNYESLDSFVSQALDAALEQGLGIRNIDDVMHRYRYHFVY